MESSGGGEFSFGLTLPLLGVVEIAGELCDGVVVRYPVWFEVDELFGEPVDASLEFEVALLLGGVLGSGVGEFVSGVVMESVEPVGDLTQRLQCGCGWGGGGEFAAGAGGGVVQRGRLQGSVRGHRSHRECRGCR